MIIKIIVYYNLRMRGHEFEHEWKGHQRNLREKNYTHDIIIFEELRNNSNPAITLLGI